MKVGDVTCPACDTGFRGIELSSRMGAPSEYRCPVCNTLIEVWTPRRISRIALPLSRQNFLVSRSVESGADGNVEIYRNLTLPREFICR